MSAAAQTKPVFIMPSATLLLLVVALANAFFPKFPESVTPLEIVIALASFWLLWDEASVLTGKLWVIAGTCLLVLIPSAVLSWAALLLLSGSLYLSAKPTRAKEGLEILALLAAFEILATVSLKFIAGPVLTAEAEGVRLVLNALGVVATGSGNLIDVGDNRLVVLLACSGLQNAGLAWISFRLATLLSFPDAKQSFWKQGLLTVIIIMAVNQIRLTIIAYLPAAYYFLHGPTGSVVLDCISLTVVALMLLSAAKTAKASQGISG
jgi:hypothetical protein